MINKKIILGILTIGMLAVVAGAGTFAWFSSTASSTGNQIHTGTVSLTKGVDTVATLGLAVPSTAGPIEVESLTLVNAATVATNLNCVVTAGTTSTVFPEGMTINANVNGVDHPISHGANTFSVTGIPAGQNIPVIISYTFPELGHEQTGQDVLIPISGSFTLTTQA